MSQKENNNMDKHFYRASAADFNKIRESHCILDARKYWSAFENTKLLTCAIPKKDGDNR
jgi:hypothetical protein